MLSRPPLPDSTWSCLKIFLPLASSGWRSRMLLRAFQDAPVQRASPQHGSRETVPCRTFRLLCAPGRLSCQKIVSLERAESLCCPDVRVSGSQRKSEMRGSDPRKPAARAEPIRDTSPPPPGPLEADFPAQPSPVPRSDFHSDYAQVSPEGRWPQAAPPISFLSSAI